MSKIEIIESNFTVVVKYKYNNFMEIGPIDDRIIEIADRNRKSSTAEMGNRSLVFCFLTKEEATNIAIRLMHVDDIEGLDIDVYQDQGE